MEKRVSTSRPDRVFVLRVWQDDGSPSRRLTEVKEVGTTRQSDKRRVVDNLSAAFEIVRWWLGER